MQVNSGQPTTTANRDIVAIGTSAGGVKALTYLAARLPSDFPAAVLVTIHLPSDARSEFDRILTRAGQLPASFAADGDALSKGRIYIAPPGRHLILDEDKLSLGRGPRENHARPAIDPMLRSVAIRSGPRSIGVVLTGTQSDGASGLWAVKQCGGIAVVQDPADAAYPEMPLTALNRSQPHHVVHLQMMPALLETLVKQPPGEDRPVPESLRYEVEIARSGRASMNGMDRLGRRSVLTCPDCNGVLWEIDENELVRFRCHLGHAFGAELMNLAIEENLRRALGSALRALEERTVLVEKLYNQAAAQGHDQIAQHWARKKAESEEEAEVIRQAISRADEIAAVMEA